MAQTNQIVFLMRHACSMHVGTFFIWRCTVLYLYPRVQRGSYGDNSHCHLPLGCAVTHMFLASITDVAPAHPPKVLFVHNLFTQQSGAFSTSQLAENDRHGTLSTSCSGSVNAIMFWRDFATPDALHDSQSAVRQIWSLLCSTHGALNPRNMLPLLIVQQVDHWQQPQWLKLSRTS